MLKPTQTSPFAGAARRCVAVAGAALTALGLFALPVLGARRAAHAADACPGSSLIPDRSDLAAVDNTLVCLINGERALSGLAPLASERGLTGAAVRHSRDMIRHDYFADLPPADASALQVVSAAGYPCPPCSAGVNVAWGVGQLATPRAIVNAWMASPPHRANLLSAVFRATGIGLAIGHPRAVWPGGGGVTVTQVLAGA